MSGKFLIPNEDGILVQSDVPSIEPLSEGEKALSLAANSGGSGQGMSHYALASRCGRRARLSARRYEGFKEREAPLPLTKNHFIVGSVYHKLHELARRPNDGLVIDFDEQYQNPNVAEGLRLYKGWLRTWGLDFWGKCLGVEVHLADTDTFNGKREVFRDARGNYIDSPDEPIRVSGQIDMVVEMDDAACERAKKRGLDLPPGRRLVDWKTADAPGDGLTYTEGVQALWYMHLYNLHHPDAPVDGIIFDVVYKRSRRKARSVLLDDFGAYHVLEGRENVETLRGMVLQGHRNIAEDIPNRSECITWRGEVCPFRANGECDAK